MSAHLITYALHEGKLVHISEVQNGLKCDCYCPACSGRLVARKGKIKAAHFAHYATEECLHGYETSLHLAAKYIIAEHKELMLPALYLSFPYSFKNQILISDEKKVKVNNVFLETTIADIIPDVIIESNGKKLLIEIYVTHKINEQKLNKIRHLGISTLEIDLSHINSACAPEELYQAIVLNTDKKEWIYNVLQDKYSKKFIDAAEQIYRRERSNYTENCPISIKVWEGNPNAHILYDCLLCRFCLAKDDISVLCTGKNRIAKIEDFNKPFQERFDYYERELDRDKMWSISRGVCPVCGHRLVDRKGPNSSFIGCSNYPHCKFTININPETGEMKIKDKF